MFCFVDAGLEALGCHDEDYLVVNLTIRDMPGCCPRQLGEGWRVESVDKGEPVAFANSRSLHLQSYVSPMPNLPTAQSWYASEPTFAFQST